MQLEVIARIQSGFPAKFGIPRQSGMVKDLRADIFFEEDFRDPQALRGLEAFSHIWLLWGFSAHNKKAWSPTVRPPRLGGNARMGVFATRSPYRPNAIGLSCVELAGLELNGPKGPVLHVRGADLMNGTPIYDIKPYLPYTDSWPDATGGFTDDVPQALLQVDIAPHWCALLSPQDEKVLRELLAQDPRPPYQRDARRVYGMAFGGFEVKFAVEEERLTVLSVRQEEEALPARKFEK